MLAEFNVRLWSVCSGESLPEAESAFAVVLSAEAVPAAKVTPSKTDATPTDNF